MSSGVSRDTRFSVCIALHNGERFLREQMQSILEQLGDADDIIAVDDASVDGTVAIIESLVDSRIHLIRQSRNCGVVKTFERALRAAQGDIVFLSDQDDAWLPNKIAAVAEVFARSPEVTLVLTDAVLIDAEGRSIGAKLHREKEVPLGVLKNLVRNRFQGCVMAFRREILQAALPFPDNIPMHDSWIGLVNSVAGRPFYLPEPLIKYRRHEGAVTTGRHESWRRMLAQRMILIVSLIRRRDALIRLRRQLSVCAKTGAHSPVQRIPQ